MPKTFQVKTSNLTSIEKRTIEKPPVRKRSDPDEVRIINVDTTFANIVAEFLGIDPKVYEENPYKVEIFIDQAYRLVTTKMEHLKDAPVDFFTEDPKTRTLFARFVALCIRTDRAISGKGYELNKNYLRINLEKKQVINYFYTVRYVPKPKYDEVYDIKEIQKSVEISNKVKAKNKMSSNDDTLKINKVLY